MIPKLSERYRVSEHPNHPNYFAVVDCAKARIPTPIGFAPTRSEAEDLAYKLNQLDTIKHVCSSTIEWD